MKKFAARAVTVLTAATATVALAASGAQAAGASFVDRTGDIRPGIDLTSVTVRNGAETVKVVLEHRNLRRSPQGSPGGTIYIDVNRADAGPEYALVAGLFEGTDYALLSVDGWKVRRSADRVNCDYSLRLRYLRDRSVARFDQACFGDVDRLRFEVRTSAQRADGTMATDWLGAKRQFTRWVAAG